MNERVNKLDCEKVIQNTGAQGVTEMVDRWMDISWVLGQVRLLDLHRKLVLG